MTHGLPADGFHPKIWGVLKNALQVMSLVLQVKAQNALHTVKGPYADMIKRSAVATIDCITCQSELYT